MSQHKWLKLGAATFLSIGMLAACGDEDLEYEDPGADFEDGGDEGPAPEVNEGDDGTELDQNPGDGDETDEQLEDDMEDEQDEDSDSGS